MARVVELADFRPSPRHDGQAWTEVRVEESDSPDGRQWDVVETISLASSDDDPVKPALRSITSSKVTEGWVRLVFLHEEGEDRPCPFISIESPHYIPTLAGISSILRARTYGVGDQELVGGELIGEFNDDTRPTKKEVEGKLTSEAVNDLLTAIGEVPGELMDRARRLASIRVAVEIERSYISEMADEGATLYQTLRITFDEEVAKLQRTLQLWVLSRQMERERSAGN